MSEDTHDSNSPIPFGSITECNPPKDELQNFEICQTKIFRRKLDEVLQLIRNVSPSRERALAITKLQEAIMWLGLDLKERAGGVSCYQHGYDPSNAKVDPTPDGVKL